MKALLYCTKSKPYLYKHFKKDFFISNTYNKLCVNNGKIVAECDFEVEKIFRTFDIRKDFYTTKVNVDDLYNEACLTYEELCDYLGNGNNGSGYAIHIKNLKVFDKPKSLSDYGKKAEKIGDTQYYKVLDKAPQNMMYVIDEQGNKYVLISIRPEWLCKILNGEKKIEVRRKVLKEMVK